MTRVAGLDLAASPRRPTGYALAEKGELVRHGVVFTDDEVIKAVGSARVVAVDAPLTLPEGGRGFRRVDLKLLSMGYRLLPVSLPGMRALALRAVKLRAALERAGVGEVIETHPRSAWLSSRCRDPLEAACRVLRCGRRPRGLTEHEVDAILAAAVAYAYAEGSSVAVEAEDGVIHLLPPVCG